MFFFYAHATFVQKIIISSKTHNFSEKTMFFAKLLLDLHKKLKKNRLLPTRTIDKQESQKTITIY